MKRQPETRAAGGPCRPRSGGCANARRAPVWPGPGLHRPSSRPPSPPPEDEDRTAEARLPGSSACGHNPKSHGLRRRSQSRGLQSRRLQRPAGRADAGLRPTLPSQSHRGVSAGPANGEEEHPRPFCRLSKFPSIRLLFLLELTPLRSRPTEDAERRDFRRTHARTHAHAPEPDFSQRSQKASRWGDTMVMQDGSAWSALGLKVRRDGVCKSLLLPVPLNATKTLRRIHGAAGSRGIREGNESF